MKVTFEGTPDEITVQVKEYIAALKVKKAPKKTDDAAPAAPAPAPAPAPAAPPAAPPPAAPAPAAPAPAAPAAAPPPAPAPAPAAVPAAPPAPAAAPAAPAPVADTGGWTVDHVSTAMNDRIQNGVDGMAIMNLLREQFGVMAAAQLPPERYAEAYQAISAMQ